MFYQRLPRPRTLGNEPPRLFYLVKSWPCPLCFISGQPRPFCFSGNPSPRGYELSYLHFPPCVSLTDSGHHKILHVHTLQLTDVVFNYRHLFTTTLNSVLLNIALLSANQRTPFQLILVKNPHPTPHTHRDQPLVRTSLFFSDKLLAHYLWTWQPCKLSFPTKPCSNMLRAPRLIRVCVRFAA